MLFSYVGTIGQEAVIHENDRYYLAPNIALIRVDKTLVDPEYIRYFFQTSAFFGNADQSSVAIIVYAEYS